jgi:hypothetical protein
MALVPNFWTDSVIDVPITPNEWTEGLGAMAIRSGYYRGAGQGSTKGRSSAGDDSILLEKFQTLTNQYGTIMRRDEERWSYEVVNGPPQEYKRVTEWGGYLPGIGRGLRKVEEEITQYWTFTPWTDGDNLGRTRLISAMCVYDLPVKPTKPASQDAKDKAEDAGLIPGNLQSQILATGRIWSEGNKNSSFVEQAGAPQAVKWVDDVIIEHDVVEEQPDRWLIWTVVKNKLKPQDVQIRGPRDVKKTGFVYQYPYPVDPPKLEVSNRSEGIHCEAKGGGSIIINKYFGEKGTIQIPADKYNFYRRKVTDPPRTGDPDLYDWWDVDPPLPEERKIITNTAATLLDGSPTTPPNSTLPAQTSYSEPGDDSEADEPYETAFQLIATVTNAKVEQRYDSGFAEFYDQDVVDGAEYEYYATALIAETESPDSNHELITYSGPERHHHRLILFEGGAEATAPEDPTIPDTDYGEVEEFDVPLDDEEGDVEELIEDVAERQFAQNEPDFIIDLDVLIPMLGLEYGQMVELPVIDWEVYSNGLHVSQETQNDDWMLVGFQMDFSRTPDGKWKSQRTKLRLQERTKN